MGLCLPAVVVGLFFLFIIFIMRNLAIKQGYLFEGGKK